MTKDNNNQTKAKELVELTWDGVKNTLKNKVGTHFNGQRISGTEVYTIDKVLKLKDYDNAKTPTELDNHFSNWLEQKANQFNATAYEVVYQKLIKAAPETTKAPVYDFSKEVGVVFYRKTNNKNQVTQNRAYNKSGVLL